MKIKFVSTISLSAQIKTISRVKLYRNEINIATSERRDLSPLQEICKTHFVVKIMP